MTLAEWRSRADLVGEAKRIMADPVLMRMIEILHVEHPHNYHIPVSSSDSAQLELGRIRGYDNCLSNLEAFCVHVPTPQPIQEDWGVETKP